MDKSVLTADELSGIIAALKGIGSVSERTKIERTLDKLGAGSDAVVSLSEPVVIDLASYYKGQLTGKIETIKRAVYEKKIIEFDYFYEKGDARRRVEPYVIVFKWTSWYVFGYCLDRRDWRLFKLLRLWNLKICDERCAPREIPLGIRDFELSFGDDIHLVAVFDPSVKYRLIESYGLDCYTETDGGLLFEFHYENRAFLLNWLLGFGDKVKVIEPQDIIEEIRNTAKNILRLYD